MYKFILLTLVINCSYNPINKNTDSLISNFYIFHNGSIPVLFTVLHDGSYILQNTPSRIDSSDHYNIRNDLHTKLISDKIYSELFTNYQFKPYMLINKVHRKFVDLNRSPEYAYESDIGKKVYDDYYEKLFNVLSSMLLKYNKIYLFDIHGFSSDTADIVISTRNHSTVDSNDLDALVYNNNSLKNVLHETGFNIKINDPFYGGYIIKTVNEKFNSKNVNSIQIEIGELIRFNNKEMDMFINKFSEYINREVK